MNDENLIPLNKRSKSEQRRIQSMGGKTVTPAKRIANKLVALKKKGLTDESAKRIYELMTDLDMHDLDILMYLESMRRDAKTLQEKNAVSRTIMDFRKMRHGSNDKPTINIQNNIINIDETELKDILNNLQR